MKLSQLEYIIALDQHRHFVNAAEACGVTQPTLSMMISKLESELDIQIFDRTKHPIEPTSMGEKIIEQARKTLREVDKLPELIRSEQELMEGELRLGLIPTLSSYLLPKFIQDFTVNNPGLELKIFEMETDTLIHELEAERIDMFIAATPLDHPEFYEVPLYYEAFKAYFSSDHPDKNKKLSAKNLPTDNLWVLREGHCFRDQIMNFCKKKMNYNHSFEAGSVDSLVRIVDQNGGYTIIPELHLDLLDAEQKKNVRSIEGPPVNREISIVIKENFIREKMINTVADSIKKIIPDEMLNTKLKKHSIRLR